ncbi:transposase [Agrobacterium salinitolerans]|uniref:Transposase n=1 Tax=Agrobacterium salinitolerans TaxID=1183413 RepID=A0A9X3KPB9_9HYPH|nr:transposase [Agrobacterium salinitolerans]MCZ7938419.1 transposase [Agrobacterium salinitolerans]
MHAAYDPSRSRFTYLDVSDAHGGEAFTRLPITEGDIFIGDRAYARAPSLAKLLATGADFIVRSGWHSIRLVTLDGNPVDWNAIYAPMKMGDIREIDVFVEHSGRKQRGKGKPLFRARLIIKRKDAEAAERALKTAKRGHQRRRYNQTMQPTTMAAAGFIMVLTSPPSSAMTAEVVLDTYRLRWQVELAFKRLKSGLGIDKLPAKDPQLARIWLMAHLILALMIDEAVNDVLDSPPLGMRTASTTSISLWRLHSLLRQVFSECHRCLFVARTDAYPFRRCRSTYLRPTATAPEPILYGKKGVVTAQPQLLPTAVSASIWRKPTKLSSRRPPERTARE